MQLPKAMPKAEQQRAHPPATRAVGVGNGSASAGERSIDMPLLACAV